MKSSRSSSKSEVATWMASSARTVGSVKAPARVRTSRPTAASARVARTASARAMSSTGSAAGRSAAMRRSARGTSAIAISLLTSRPPVTVSTRSALSASSAMSLTIADVSRYSGATSAFATDLFERLGERHPLAGQLDRPEVSRRARRRRDLALGDQAVERAAAVDGHQLGDRAVAIGHHQPFAARHATHVLSQVLTQLRHAHGVGHVHERSIAQGRYVTDCWYTV